MEYYSRRRIEVDLRRVRNLLDAGCSGRMVANALGVSPGVVGRVLREQGWAAAGVPRAPRRPHPLLDRVRDLAGRGLTRTAIAAELATTYNVVNSICHFHRLEVARSGNPVDHAEVARLHGLGLTTPQVAGVLGARTTQVRDSLRSRGLRPHLRDREKIPPSAADLIRRLCDQGWLESEVAQLYGARQSSVSKYLIKHRIAPSCGRGRRRGG